MKIFRMFLFLIGAAVHFSATARPDSVTINNLVLDVRDSNENLHHVSKEDICYVQELLNDDTVSIDRDKVSGEVKAIFAALLKECAERIALAEKNENSFKSAGFFGFFASMLLTLAAGADALPEISNVAINKHLHSKDTQAVALLTTFPLVFYAFYKAQRYQDAKIELQEIQKSILKLNVSLSLN